MYTADDTAIFMIRTQGVGSEAVHKPAWDAFAEGMEVSLNRRVFMEPVRACSKRPFRRSPLFR